MNYPVEATSREAKASFHVFGTEVYKDRVLKAVETGNIRLQLTQGKLSYPAAFIQDENVGRAWILNEEESPIVCVVQNHTGEEDAFFPWDYKEKEMAVFEVRKGMVSDSLSVFSEFVQFMEKFQDQFSCWLNAKTQQETIQPHVPSAFFGLLEYEFFRQLVPGVNKIEFSVAFNEGTLGLYAFVMAKAIDDENESLDFCGIIKL